MHMMEELLVVTTGGTIDKIYFDDKSDYQIGDPQIGMILRELGVTFRFNVIPILRKDSLHINSSIDSGGRSGVKLRVIMLNCAVFNFSTTVWPTRSVLRVAFQVFSANCTIASPRSSSSRSSAKVSSEEIDCT
ncbi:hypothetical protein, partial [Rhizobium ruizarguesonis]|uniref:hypothetical protein n=1 Tax=Rhizobium ruizarguesonis TaxID=2081791 RepID=UPI001FD3AFA6